MAARSASVAKPGASAAGAGPWGAALRDRQGCRVRVAAAGRDESDRDRAAVRVRERLAAAAAGGQDAGRPGPAVGWGRCASAADASTSPDPAEPPDERPAVRLSWGEPVPAGGRSGSASCSAVDEEPVVRAEEPADGAAAEGARDERAPSACRDAVRMGLPPRREAAGPPGSPVKESMEMPPKELGQPVAARGSAAAPGKRAEATRLAIPGVLRS